MSRDLSTRQKKFIQAKLEGKSNARAAREAGYSESVANVAGQKILNHPAVQAKLQQLMERASLTDERLTATIQVPNDAGRFVQVRQLDYTVRYIA
jgi:phage terminase small subunit